MKRNITETEVDNKKEVSKNVQVQLDSLINSILNNQFVKMNSNFLPKDLLSLVSKYHYHWKIRQCRPGIYFARQLTESNICQRITINCFYIYFKNTKLGSEKVWCFDRTSPKKKNNFVYHCDVVKIPGVSKHMHVHAMFPPPLVKKR